MSHFEWKLMLWTGMLLILFAAWPSAGEEPVGTVAVLRGSAVAERPGEAPRNLRCHDPVFRGESVVTREGSHAGILVGDVLAHLDQRSALRVDTGAAGAADLRLQQGGVRVIDPRDGGPPAQLAVLDAGAGVQGNDAEAHLLGEKAGSYAMLCEWDEPLAVARAGEALTADPGRCVIAKQGEPLYLANAHTERIGDPAEDACRADPVIGGLDTHLSPTDVAAGPIQGPWSGPPGPGEPPVRSACDVPGSPCLLQVELPPTGGEVPGGGGPPPGS